MGSKNKNARIRTTCDIESDISHTPESCHTGPGDELIYSKLHKLLWRCYTILIGTMRVLGWLGWPLSKKLVRWVTTRTYRSGASGTNSGFSLRLGDSDMGSLIICIGSCKNLRCCPLTQLNLIWRHVSTAAKTRTTRRLIFKAKQRISFLLDTLDSDLLRSAGFRRLKAERGAK